MNKIIDFIKRNLTTIIIGALALYVGIPTIIEFQTVAYIIAFEMLAITLSGFALWAYTKFNFTEGLMYGKDGEANSIEQTAIMKLFGYVFLAVHFLVGLGLVGIYFGKV